MPGRDRCKHCSTRPVADSTEGDLCEECEPEHVCELCLGPTSAHYAANLNGEWLPVCGVHANAIEDGTWTGTGTKHEVRDIDPSGIDGVAFV